MLGRRRTSLKHVLFVLLSSALFGAGATIGAAWLCRAFDANADGLVVDSQLESTGPWIVFTRREFGVWQVAAVISRESSAALRIEDPNIPGWSRLHDLPEYRRGDPMRVLVDSAYGWPILSMWYSVDGESDSQTRSAPSRRASGVFSDAELPIRILVIGFAGDLVFFAFVFLAILFVPRGVRRWWRGVRGRCHSCGYDLRNDLAAGCPECGWRRNDEDAQQPS